MASAACGDSPIERTYRPIRVRYRYSAASATTTHDAYTSADSLNSTGPTIGTFFSPNTLMLLNWCLPAWPPRFLIAPKYDDRPMMPAKIVTVRPDTIWLARSVIVMNAWNIDSLSEATAEPTAANSTTTTAS